MYNATVVELLSKVNQLSYKFPTTETIYLILQTGQDIKLLVFSIVSFLHSCHDQNNADRSKNVDFCNSEVHTITWPSP